MHELGIVMEVLDVVAERSEGARVARVVLEVGSLTAVLPEALTFAFELATEGTPAEGARLDIVRSEGTTLALKEMEVY